MRIARTAAIAAVMVCAIPQAVGDPFPPDWGVGTVDEASGPIHFAPSAWPSEPVDPTQCGSSCGQWLPYTRFQGQINDPRVQDPSNGGTAPQNYVNIASSCIDKAAPSIYYYLYKHPTDQAKDVLMFRWRVEQIANNYATGPSAGNFGATDPWSSGLWTVLFDVDGSGYRSLAAHLNGSSGDPSHQVDLLAGIWGNIPTQSIDYLNDPNIHRIAHNPTALASGSKILNFHNSLTPDATWPAGSTANGTTYDYGTTRARVASNNACTEYFVDYQIPIRMLDATPSGPNPALNGPKITRSTPLAMLFCTANSLNNPFQKDCALNRGWLADANKPAPFGDYISFDQTAPYAQPIVSSVTATAPTSCPGNYALQSRVQDTLYVDSSGSIKPSVKQVQFFYWHDANGDGSTAGDPGSTWISAATATLKPGTLNTWSANWDSTTLAKGKYLIGVQAVDDRTLHDDGVADAPVDNRTFSYLTGSTASSNAAELAVQGKIYTNAWSFDGTTKTWIQGANIGWIGVVPIAGTDQQAAFAAQPHALPMSSGTTEDWFGNPAVTGVQTALVGLAVNACGVAPTITKTVNPSSVATGQPVTYTVTIANATGAAITLTQIDDPLPSGFTYTSTTSVNNNGAPVAPTTAPASGASGTVSWILNGGTGISIANGTSVVLTFIATASGTAGTYNNTATASTSFGPIASTPVAVGVDAARISLSKTPNTYLVSPGGSVTYTLAYSNDSSVAVTAAMLTDTLPANVSCTSYMVNGGSPVACSGTGVPISLGTLAAGATGTVALTATVAAGYATTSLINSATLDVVAPDGSTHLTKTATSTIAVNVPAPAFSLTKTASAAQIAENANVTWTIAYNNYGTGPASSAVISDPLPSGFTYVTSAPVATSAPTVGTNGTVSWNLGSVASGASGSVQVVAKSTTPFTGTSNPATNVATLSWTGGTPVTSSSDVGVTQSGSTCSSYYFRGTTGNVGFDGTRQLATRSPVPIAADTGSTTTVTAPGKSGGVYLEAVRFYQDPASGADVTFSGTLTNSIYIDRDPGPALNFRAIVYDYDSTTGATTQLGLADPTTDAGMSFGGSTTGLLTFSVPLSGVLAKGHRLLWVYEVQSNHNTTAFPVQFQYNGTVTNGVSGGTTAAISFANYCVTPPANLVLQKAVDASTVNVTGSGRTLAYTVNYTNTSGSTAATLAVLSDPLPAGTTFVSASSTPAATSTVTPAIGANGTVIWNFASIAAGASGSTSVTVNVPDDLAGTTAINNTASLSSTQTTAINATATTSIVGGGAVGTPSLSVTKTANKTLLLAGEAATYTLSVVNVGTGNASSVVVSDDFPEQAYFAYGSCVTATGLCNQVGGVLTWNVGALAAGANATLTFTMTVAATGVPAGVTTLDNLATVTDSVYCTGGSPPASCTSGTVTVSISGNPNLTLIKSATPNNGLNPGDTVSYSMTVTNTGSAIAKNVTVNDPIPPGAAFKGSITATAGSGSFDAVNNGVVYSVGDLVAGASATLSFQVAVLTPPAGTTAISTSNVATATADNAPAKIASASASGSATPSLTLNKSGTASVPYPAATLSAAVTAGATVGVYSTLNVDAGQTVRINGTNRQVLSKTVNSLTLDGVVTAVAGTGVLPAISYVISYKNTGTGIAPSVVLTDMLPGGALFVTASDGAIEAAGTITWTIGDVAPGVSGSVTVTMIPGATGNISNSAHVTCTGCTPPADPVASSVVGGLIISKRTTTPLVSAGGSASYVITVENTLGTAVSGALLSLTDNLPGGFTYASSAGLTINGAAATAAANPVAPDQFPTWSNFSANIGAGQSLVLTITVNVDPNQGPGVFQNGVTATTAEAGIAITPFDPLSTTAEDVTVPPAGTGLINGHIFLDTGGAPVAWDAADGAYSGIRVTMENAASAAGICSTTPSDPGCYIAYTDAGGVFSTIVPAGSWIVTNAAPAGGVSRTVGLNPKTLTVSVGAVSTQDVGYNTAVAPPAAADDTGTTPANTVLVSNTPAAGQSVNNGSIVNNDSGTGIALYSVTGTGGACTGFPCSIATTHGSAVVQSSGIYAYTPANLYSGADSFTYQIRDSALQTANATVNLTVIPVAANDGTYSVAANGTTTGGGANILANDAGSSLHVASVTGSGAACTVFPCTISTAHGSAVMQSTGTFSYTPTSGYAGSDSFAYVADDGSSNSNSATVSFNVTPPASSNGSVSGSVWYDVNHNQRRDSAEAGRPGWPVELLSGTSVIAATTTGATGQYTFAGLAAGTYSVRFINPNGATLVSGPTPVNGEAGSPVPGGGSAAYCLLAGIVLTTDGNGNVSGVVQQGLPLDPSGVVYDSATRLPIAGAVVTLLDNGSPINSLYVAGGSATQTTGVDGSYSFFLLPGAPAHTYSLTVSRAAYTFVSAAIPPASGDWAAGGAITPVVGAPPAGQPTTYYLSGPLPVADVTNNNIPLDPAIPSAVMAIPTLSELMIFMLAGLVLLSGFAATRKRAR